MIHIFILISSDIIRKDKKLNELLINQFISFQIFFKMDLTGSGTLVEANKLHICMNLRPDVYTFDKFRYMCILSGCDYLESLPGIGIKKALKFISLTANMDMYNVSKSL